MSTEMTAVLRMGGFALVEEILEDLVVLTVNTFSPSVLPRWSELDYYQDLDPEHPNQVVQNPSHRYYKMDRLFTASVVTTTVFFAYAFVIGMVGANAAAPGSGVFGLGIAVVVSESVIWVWDVASGIWGMGFG